MVNIIHTAYKAEDRSYFSILKKEIHAKAAAAGFTERKVGEIDIVVAELVSNLVRHGGGGQLFVKLIEESEVQGIEIISVDSGPGIADVNRVMEDGVSTKGSLGQGLGAIKRLSQVFQVYSQRNWGTIVLVRVFNEEMPNFRKPPKADIRYLALPKPGEEYCGDRFISVTTPQHIKLFFGDGLGHGPEAEKAVTMACDAFQKFTDPDPVQIIRYLNSEVKKSRGLVGTAAVFDVKAATWRICGVGNISTRMYNGAVPKNHMSYNGIIGLNVPNTLNAQESPYEKGQLLIMCSDGLKSRWDMLKFPSVLRYDYSVLLAALIKDFARHTDDMSVMACKIN
ncbi:SpoIIE family protein phosphatase [Sediminibacterium roseum]|uniref:SpoIIE family protein phosphatase n=1 Tax=Sediminibacterium roseum TaxID=1978412 RepID=A0ABW9ZUP8_9BACT|nr:ATP-binding SpoIIE family protein phosphatase [Sediminibacterium roseum]NCI49467.1 SpoIIE family protein phosphatase [Sediminibacterium roseum]